MTPKGIRRPIIAMLLTLTGCTKENFADCYQGFELDYDFTLHTNTGNRFDEDVQSVRTYLFDENDILQYWAVDNGSVLREFYLNKGKADSIATPNPWGALPNNYVMRLAKVAPGKYKIMSWAGSGREDHTTYFHGHMNDPVTHDFERGVTLGRTTMQDFRLFVDYRDADEYPDEAIIPVVDEIDDLWYGAVGRRNEEDASYTFESVVIKSGDNTKRHIELIRNTNILKVTVSGIEYINGGVAAKNALPPIAQLWVRASNGRYKADNTVGENARTIRYNPHTVNLGNDQLLADIKVLSLNMEQRTAQPMWLYLQDNNGSQFPQGGLDVVNTLLQARKPDGTFVYRNQTDFYKQYEHQIEIEIAVDLSVKIFVNGWETTPVKPEV